VSLNLIFDIKNNSEHIEFKDIMDFISEHYAYRETAFSNGVGEDIVINKPGENAGSCRIFAFAQLNALSKEETLACFGRYYRDDVLGNPEGRDHANIRTFMRYGWPGIKFEGVPLTAKS